MKLSNSTIEVLKNFAGININLLFRKGNELRTISPQKTIFAVATINDNIEGEAGIYDLSNFLAVVSVLGDPDIKFGEKSFTLTSGDGKQSFRYAAESLLLIPPEKDLQIPDVIEKVKVPWSTINKVIKLAAVNQSPDIGFLAEDGVLYLQAYESTNTSANVFRTKLGVTEKDNFTMIIKTENMKIIPSEYYISITNQAIKFEKTEGNSLTYFVAVQHNSK